jgi:hypothetical protein
MALFIRQDDNRSELQQRLAAELQEKAKKRAQLDNTPSDDIEDSNYLKGTKKTTSLAWIWLLVAIIFILIVAASFFVVGKA